MINISDLHIQTEIIPLFDHTDCERSRVELEKIFLELPQTLNETTGRQDIIKAFIKNWELLHDFHYSKVDINEVTRTTIDFCSIDPAGLRWRILKSKKVADRLRSRAMQFILFFESLNTLYFSCIDLNKFPALYAGRLNKLTNYLDTFQVSFYASLIRKDKFTFKHTRAIVGIFSQPDLRSQAEQAWTIFHEFEAFHSIAKTAIRYGYHFPDFVSSGFEISGFYHPLLKAPVKNDFVSSGHVHLITGANMSGKSTFLKAISLCVYLGRIGLPVAAGKCSIPFFDAISVCISKHDDLSSGYSHFRLQLKSLKDILVAADNGQHCFAVFDELFNATNAEDAFEITKLTLQGLSSRHDCISFISTHLQGLKQFVELNQLISSYHIECVVENGRPTFSYKIKPGCAEIKIGRLLFESEGLARLVNARPDGTGNDKTPER